MNVRFAFFDFDNTLSRGDSVVPFLLYAVRHGYAPPSQLLRAVRGYLHQLRHPEQVSYSKSIALSFIKGRRREELFGRAITPPARGLFWGQGVATPAAFPWNSTDYCLRKDDSQFPPRERFH